MHCRLATSEIGGWALAKPGLLYVDNFLYSAIMRKTIDYYITKRKKYT